MKSQQNKIELVTRPGSSQVSIDKQKIDREVANYCQERLRSINTDFTLDKVSRQEATFALRDEAASYLKSVKNIDPAITKDSFTSLARKSIAGLVTHFVHFGFLPAARLVNMCCWSRGGQGQVTFSFLETSVHVQRF